MKITREELAELNSEGSVEVRCRIGTKEYWEIIELDKEGIKS